MKKYSTVQQGFLGDSVVKNPLENAGDAGSIPGLGRSPGLGNGKPLQYSCQGNLMHGQRSLTDYSLWGLERIGHDLAAKQLYSNWHTGACSHL